MKDGAVVSGTPKEIDEHLSTDKDDTLDSKLRRLLNTSTSDEEVKTPSRVTWEIVMGNMLINQ